MSTAFVQRSRRSVIKALLWCLNSPLLNSGPCRYGFINNLDAFSYENLVSEDHQRPGITVRAILDEAARFKSCPFQENGVMVIEGETVREATVWDMRELRETLGTKAVDGEYRD